LPFASVAFLAFAFSCAAQTSRVAAPFKGASWTRVQCDRRRERNSTQSGTNQTRTMLSNAQDFFRAGELPVGQYELRVESPGFSPYVNSAIVTSIGRYFSSSPTCTRHSTTASHGFEQPAPIDPPRLLKATTIDHERIEESPVVSRNYLDFVLLAPQLTRSNIHGATGAKRPLPTADSPSRSAFSQQ